MAHEAEPRKRMVEEQIARRGVKDPATLQAMLIVPRHEFVPEPLKSSAYADSPLPIGEGQTISQPYIVALMTAAAGLQPQSKVLDIGTGSGYAAAVLSFIVDQVYSIERIPQLTHNAQALYDKLGYKNIYLKTGDGTLGWPEKGPYDAIIVTAGAPVVPQQLTDQLKNGGCLIIPVGDSYSQKLMRYRKESDGKLSEEILEHVRFVPLIGEHGW